MLWFCLLSFLYETTKTLASFASDVVVLLVQNGMWFDPSTSEAALNRRIEEVEQDNLGCGV